MDDLVLCASKLADMVEIKTFLKEKFDMSDLGDIHHILGMKVTRDREKRTISLSQDVFIQDHEIQHG